MISTEPADLNLPQLSYRQAAMAVEIRADLMPGMEGRFSPRAAAGPGRAIPTAGNGLETVRKAGRSASAAAGRAARDRSVFLDDGSPSRPGRKRGWRSVSAGCGKRYAPFKDVTRTGGQPRKPMRRLRG